MENWTDEAVNQVIGTLRSQLAAERALADNLADVLAHMVVGWKGQTGIDLAEHPSVVAVMAMYRRARGREEALRAPDTGGAQPYDQEVAE